MYDVAVEQEKSFREWMRRQLNSEGIRRYTDNAIIAYCYTLKTACSKLQSIVKGNLFYVTTAQEFEHLYEKILNADNFEEINRGSGNGAFDVALRLYRIFLNEGMVSQDMDFEAPFYLRSIAEKTEDYTEDRGIEFTYDEVPMKPVQCIFYGAPGTGKSYMVRHMLEQEYPDPKERDAHCKRLIFHPTYSYGDFVGCIKPMISLDHPLDYMYYAGPFTALLKEAFLYPAEKFYLIIEEINRGNAPAIFGDLFQLLDRQEGGRSMYPVQNDDVSAYFSRDPSLKKLFYEGKIWLPPNFNIIGTMNTADENIFVLDSAFKRRFSLKYVRIDFRDLPQEWQREYKTFAGERSLAEIFTGTALESFVREMEREGTLRRNWPTFARLVNQIVDMLNQDAAEHGKPELARIPENKKLGAFFVSDEELENTEDFFDKVIFYLKQDVFTYSSHYMKESYEAIYHKYLEQGGDLFELLV